MEYGLVAVWLGLFVGLGALALPLSSVVFAPLADRGAGLAIPLAFGVLAFVGYWVGQVTFGPLAAVISLGVLALTAFVSLRAGVEMNWRRYRDATLVFTAAYLLLIVIRVADPGAYPGGGEKFLDFGLLASLLRAGSLPPEDVWFANEPVQYYYGGHMLAALFAHLTDTGAEYAYNLALAGYYAAYVTAAWGLAGAISAGVGRSYRRGAAFAAFFVAVASNLSTPVRLIIWALPDRLGSGLAAIANLDVRGLATGPLDFNYWLASRVMNAGPPGEDQWHLISEFPFFAFLNGDLHGHMMSPPLLLLGAALAYAYWRTPKEHTLRRFAVMFLAIPPVVGLLLLVNTWSAPALVGIAWLTLLFSRAPPWTLFPDSLRTRLQGWTTSRFRDEAARIAVATLLAIVIAVLGAASVAPFLSGTATGRSIGLFQGWPSRLPGLLLVHGGFLAITVGYFFSDQNRSVIAVASLLAIAGLGVTTAVGVPAVGLFVPPLLGGWYLLRTNGNVDYETVLVVGVFGLLVLVEFVYVIEDAGPGRFNTVFKVYAQVWAMWAVAAGAMASRAPGIVPSFHRVRSASRDLVTRGQKAEKPTFGTVASLFLAGLLVSSSIYAGFGVATTVAGHSGEYTLDARAYVAEDHPEEAAAIAWLDERSGQPTMVSAPGESIYQWVNAPSSLTGVPTVAGWSHEVGYRGADAYNSRVRDVDALYETSEARSRAALLDRYDVEYIYVGPIERDRYDVHAYGDEPGITVAYEDEAVTIYRIEESGLAS